MNPIVRRYRQEMAQCRRQFDGLELRQERGYLMRFVTFSANVENIMPHIPREEHEALFREVLQQQVFTSFDNAFFDAPDLVKLRGQHTRQTAPGQARIYCTYHLGSYRLLTSLLLRKGIDCVLMVGSNLQRLQGGDIQAQYEALREKRGLTNSFRIVEAGSTSGLMTILRELKAGRSLIVFVDGSPETAPDADTADQFIPVTFGQRQVMTRKGVGYLSHLTGAPIVPVVSYRQHDDQNVVEFLPALHPDRSLDRDTFSQQAMQRLFDEFWPYVQEYPGQWEGWNFIHQFLQPAQEDQPEPAQGWPEHPTFNEDRYTLCEFEHAPVLFDRRSYETYEISPDLRDLLLDLDAVTSVPELVGEEFFTELVEKEIIC